MRSTHSRLEYGEAPLSEQAFPNRKQVSMEMIGPEPAGTAVTAIAAGKAVVVVNDDGKSGDLVFAAECATPALMAFMVRRTSGFVCVALEAEDCDRLRLPSMYRHDGDRYRVTVDLRGTGTGISAAARARTAAALADAASSPGDFTRPGHVVPLQARPGGVLERTDRTEAAVDLARLAGRRPAGVLCTIMSDENPGELARREELLRFAERWGLVAVSIAELVAHRRRTEPPPPPAAASRISTGHGDLRVVTFRDRCGGAEHLALIAGTPAPDVPVYVHTECLSGNVLGSTACACGSALQERLAEFAAARSGIVVYARPAGSPRACAMFGQGTPTARPAVHEVAATVLSGLGVDSLRLHNDDVDLVDLLRSYGIRVSGQESQYATAGGR